MNFQGNLQNNPVFISFLNQFVLPFCFVLLQPWYQKLQNILNTFKKTCCLLEWLISRQKNILALLVKTPVIGKKKKGFFFKRWCEKSRITARNYVSEEKTIWQRHQRLHLRKDFSDTHQRGDGIGTFSSSTKVNLTTQVRFTQHTNLFYKEVQKRMRFYCPSTLKRTVNLYKKQILLCPY